MGEAAEWEIWRRYGMDITDDNHLERFYSKSRQQGKTAAAVTQHLHGYHDCKGHTPTSRNESLAERAKRMAAEYMADTQHFHSREEAVAFAAKLNPVGYGHRHYHPSADPLMTTINCRCVPNKPVTSKPTENEMNNLEAITLMQLQLGAVVFKAEYLNGNNNGKRYSFKDVIGLDLKKGDFVVVETRGEYAVVKVVETEVLPTEISCPFSALVHAVSKLDLAPLMHVKEAEKAANYRLSMSEVTAKLDNYRKQLGEDQFVSVSNLLAGTRRSDVVDTSVGEPDESFSTPEAPMSEAEFMRAEAARMVKAKKGGA